MENNSTSSALVKVQAEQECMEAMLTFRVVNAHHLQSVRMFHVHLSVWLICCSAQRGSAVLCWKT
eukprot:759528-Hanusia_phi.AAC.2